MISELCELIKDLKIFNRARIRYLKKCFTNHNENGKNIFIVLDNVDHYGRSTQERIFSLAAKLQDNLNVSVIMSARDYTVPVLFRHYPLAAFAPRFLHLANPNPKTMVKLRIDYIFESGIIDKIFNISEKDEIEIEHLGKTIKLNRDYVKKQIELILDSVLDNEEILLYLEKLSDYDIRSMLEMIRIVLSSGYLQPEHRDDIESIKFRDFLRALMCGNNPYYLPDDPSTKVVNIFDNSEPNFCGNNLIRLRTLQSIKVFGNNALISDVLDFMKKLGYSRQRVRKTLQDLFDYDLVESSYYEGRDIAEDNIQTIKLTKSGYFFLDYVVFNDIYLDEIKNGTYIDEDTLKQVRDLSKKGKNKAFSGINRLGYRLSSTSLFIEYLLKEEKKEATLIIESKNALSINNYEKVSPLITAIKDNYMETTYHLLRAFTSKK